MPRAFSAASLSMRGVGSRPSGGAGKGVVWMATAGDGMDGLADPPDEVRCLLALAGGGPDEADMGAVAALGDCEAGWERVARAAVYNRVAPLAYGHLRESGLSRSVPRNALRVLESAYFRSLAGAVATRDPLAAVLRRFHEAGVPAIVLRGLALGERVYGDPALRPFFDTDLLVQTHAVPRAKRLLLDVGYHIEPHDVDPRYFEKHHLHLVFAGPTTVELHWALDHKYTPYAIDSAEVFVAASPGELAGAPAWWLSEEDLLLTLCVHLVKHCYYARYLPSGTDCLRHVLADGFLVWFADVDALVRRSGDTLDWEAVLDRARRWQISPVVSVALGLAVRWLHTPVPDEVLDAVPCVMAGGLERRLARRLLPSAGGDASLLSGEMRGDALFRPARLLDLLGYVAPPAAYVAWRYGAAGPLGLPLGYARHAVTAVAELGANGVDYLVYCRLRRRR